MLLTLKRPLALLSLSLPPRFLSGEVVGFFPLNAVFIKILDDMCADVLRINWRHRMDHLFPRHPIKPAHGPRSGGPIGIPTYCIVLWRIPLSAPDYAPKIPILYRPPMIAGRCQDGDRNGDFKPTMSDDVQSKHRPT